MKLTVLGMNGPYPEPGKACSGYLMSVDSARIAVDLGSGTLSRLTEIIAPEKLDAILISHWHYDHTSDLLPLIYRLHGANKILELYAPIDENSPVRKIIVQSGAFHLHDIACGDSVHIGSCRITVGPACHPVPAVSYRFEADGKVFVYTGDTNLTEGLSLIVQGADLLLADSLFPEDAWSIDKPHLSATLAAKLAAENQVRQLVITHMDPHFDSMQLLRAAQALFHKTRLAEPGLMIEK